MRDLGGASEAGACIALAPPADGEAAAPDPQRCRLEVAAEAAGEQGVWSPFVPGWRPPAGAAAADGGGGHTIADLRRTLSLCDPRDRPEFAALLADKGVDPDFLAGWRAWTWLPDAAVVCSIEAFTDGAAIVVGARGRAVASAGWGVVVLAEARLPAGTTVLGLVGAICGPVSTDAGAKQYCGAARSTAQVAELTAAAAVLSLPLAQAAAGGAIAALTVRSDSSYHRRHHLCLAGIRQFGVGAAVAACLVGRGRRRGVPACARASRQSRQ